MQEPDYVIMGYQLFLTCGACPEQYDVLDDGDNQVGYLRLRHGRFSATYPDVGGKEVYSANPMGDGMFEDSERMYHLTKAIQMIDAEIDGSVMEVELMSGVFLEMTLPNLISLRDTLSEMIEKASDGNVR